MSDKVTEESKELARQVGITVQPDPVPNEHPSAHELCKEHLRDDARFIEPTHELNTSDLLWIKGTLESAFAMLTGSVDEAVAEMERRKQFGLAKYGTLLQPFNGRDAKQDVIEEIGDALVYTEVMLYEKANRNG